MKPNKSYDEEIFKAAVMKYGELFCKKENFRFDGIKKEHEIGRITGLYSNTRFNLEIYVGPPEWKIGFFIKENNSIYGLIDLCRINLVNKWINQHWGVDNRETSGLGKIEWDVKVIFDLISFIISHNIINSQHLDT